MSADLLGRLFGVIPNEGEITFRETVAQPDIAAVGGIPPPEFVSRLFDGIPPGSDGKRAGSSRPFVSAVRAPFHPGGTDGPPG